jgi:hypothetical protein
MKPPLKRFAIIAAVALALILALNVRVGYAETTSAAPRTVGYEISWYTIDGGGAQDLSGGSYTLSGTIGQPDAGSQSGGAYQLNGGYWVDVFGYRLYLPIILK